MKKELFIKNKKGLNLAVVVEAPDVGKRHPFVLLLHGFKGYKDEATFTNLAKALNENGVGSVRFDASGFADSEGSIEDDYRFGNYVKDTESVYAWLVRQDFVDSARIGVCGQSMGGMQAIVFASNHPELKALCVVSAPDKMATKDLLAGELPEWKKRGYLEMESSRYDFKIRFPYTFIKEAMKWDMREYVTDINCISLYIWGNADVTVKPEQTKLLFKLANEPKSHRVFKEMDHFYKRKPKVLEKVNKEIVRFFYKHL